MTSIEQQRLLNELEYYKNLVANHKIESGHKVAPSGLKKAPKGPSRSWRNPALLVPPQAAPSKILVNPNFRGNKILVNPNFEPPPPPTKILVNPAFQQPKAIHVNPKVLNSNKSPRVLFKSKNKLILKKQPAATTSGSTTKPKSSPIIFKSKTKWVRRSTTKSNKLASPSDKRKTAIKVLSGERFVSNGGTRLTRLQSIIRQAKQRSLTVLSSKRRSSLQVCTVFRKLGRCPKGDACERAHLPQTTLFKRQNKACDQQILKNDKEKKKDPRYYQSDQQEVSKAVRPVRTKTVGELPAFIPL
ncbi:uncharacterized protein LOC132194589 isoform X2 [Neocloeon triangulifer]|uniref:uncharacterized protein LOC132194589 isoform X2 n=1 Tax=Neocloeon triangulifer TaxID=2078957 RepID=UPI00286F0AF9|nr:uncharacterized protein LOC132194589 isoform X2 [Neocloeon triangulifer]